MHATNPTRREFVSGAVACAAAIPSMAAAAAAEDASKSHTAPSIRIGVRFNDQWLHSNNDDDLRFFKQIGVDVVDIELALIKGYAAEGVFAKADLASFIKRLDSVGLRIERANALAKNHLHALLNDSEARTQIDNLKRVAELVADAEIPVLGIQPCPASLLVEGERLGWARKTGRGGYEHSEFSVQRATQKASVPKYKVTSDELWKGLVNIYKGVMPIVEGTKTVIAMHGNDPPLYEHLGSPQIICRYADFARLFEEVPSKHNGMTFCVGTRYESGEDVFEGIRRFGRQGKLFHVHFRNVRGTLPARAGYEEVFVDDGDLDMGRVLGTLQEVGYGGAIDYDHSVHIMGDDPLPKQYIAFAVGYMRGLLQDQ